MKDDEIYTELNCYILNIFHIKNCLIHKFLIKKCGINKIIAIFRLKNLIIGLFDQ